MEKKLYISVVAAALCLSGLYAAEEDSVETLETIEVIEAAEIEQNSRISDTVDEQFTRETGAKSLSEALRQVPGIVSTFSEEGGTRGGVNIRGFNGIRVPVFVDGIPVFSPYDKSVDVARINTLDIHEITISKGYTSSLLGANTLGGAINIVSKRPVDGFGGELGAGISSWGGHEESASIGIGEDTFYASLSALNTQRDEYELPHNYVPDGNQKPYGYKRENADTKDLQVNFKVGLTPNDTDEYSLNYILQQGEKGQPLYAADITQAPNPFVSKWYWKDLDRTSYYVTTKTNFDIYTISSRWYYDQFYSFIDDYGHELSYNPDIKLTHKYDDRTYGAIVEGDVRLSDDKTFKVSVAQKYDIHEYTAKTIYGDNEKETIKGQTLSIGAEHSWKFNEEFTWVVGVAYDKNKITEVETECTTSSCQYVANNISGKTKETAAFSPQTILYYQLNRDLMFYGSISKKSNIPSIRQRYSTEDWRIIPNPDLEAEEAVNYEIGTEYVLNNSHLIKAAVFYAKTDDFIVMQNDFNWVDGYYTQFRNVGEETHRGVEIAVSSYWNDAFTTTISYSYIDASIKDDNVTKHYVTDLPKHNVYASLKYSPYSGVEIIPMVRYESERYTSVGSNEKSDGFTLADIRIAYRPIDDLEISGGVKNIFDKYYYYDIGYPQEGRSYYANIRYSF
ncbi:MAG: TonB-dependent receptor [Campylobacteraceae bacterium]|jgi:iron complex outermembrane receptor protein|nr:TonB-dependent receptor [Campylobacteraceae bacterium]